MSLLLFIFNVSDQKYLCLAKFREIFDPNGMLNFQENTATPVADPGAWGRGRRAPLNFDCNCYIVHIRQYIIIS